MIGHITVVTSLDAGLDPRRKGPALVVTAEGHVRACNSAVPISFRDLRLLGEELRAGLRGRCHAEGLPAESAARWSPDAHRATLGQRWECSCPPAATRREVYAVRSLHQRSDLILNWFRASGAVSSGAVEGLNNKLKIIIRRSYGFRSYDVTTTALGKLPEPPLIHRFH